MNLKAIDFGSPAAIRIVQLALTVTLAVIFAQGLWKLLGPREMARSPAKDTVATAVDLAPAAGLYGVPVQAKPPAQVNPLADVILNGIYRVGEGGGFAVVRIGNQPPRAIHAGAEIKAGVKLARLGPDHAIFLRENEELRLSLPSRPKRVTPVTKG